MSDIEQEVADALRLREQGDLEGASAVLSRLSTSDDATAAVFAVLGDIEWDMGRLIDAIHSFQRATEMAPRSETASLGLFHTLFEYGNRDGAFEEMRRFLAIADSSEYRRLLADIRDAADEA